MSVVGNVSKQHLREFGELVRFDKEKSNLVGSAIWRFVVVRTTTNEFLAIFGDFGVDRETKVWSVKCQIDKMKFVVVFVFDENLPVVDACDGLIRNLESKPLYNLVTYSFISRNLFPRIFEKKQICDISMGTVGLDDMGNIRSDIFLKEYRFLTLPSNSVKVADWLETCLVNYHIVKNFQSSKVSEILNVDRKSGEVCDNICHQFETFDTVLISKKGKANIVASSVINSAKFQGNANKKVKTKKGLCKRYNPCFKIFKLVWELFKLSMIIPFGLFYMMMLLLSAFKCKSECFCCKRKDVKNENDATDVGRKEKKIICSFDLEKIRRIKGFNEENDCKCLMFFEAQAPDALDRTALKKHVMLKFAIYVMIFVYFGVRLVVCLWLIKLVGFLATDQTTMGRKANPFVKDKNIVQRLFIYILWFIIYS